MIGSLAAVALVLALAAVYGLTASTVEQRSRELALRLALGSSECPILVAVARQIGSILLVASVLGLAALRPALRAARFEPRAAQESE